MSEREQSETEVEYQKFFNDGYTIGVYDKALASKLSQVEVGKTTLNGLKEGLQQGLRELDKSISREEELKRIRERGVDKGRGLER